MKIMKRMFSLFLASAVVLSMSVPVFAGEEKTSIQDGSAELLSSTQSVGTETALIKAIDSSSTDAADPTVITVTSDFALTKKLTVPKGHYVKLKGNSTARKLTIKGNFDDAQYDGYMAIEGMVNVKGALTVENLTLDASSLMRVIAVEGAGATVILNSGAVVTGGLLGLESECKGVGIHIEGTRTSHAKLYINDGASIKGNIKAGKNNRDYQLYGIGLHAGAYADVEMNGGFITGNLDKTTVNILKSAYGGGVYLASNTSTFVMNGGYISNNLSQKGGGGVYIDRGTFTLNAGSIQNNTTYSSGGGVLVRGKMNINGGTIKGNKATATSAIPEMGVTSYGNGGGIYIQNPNNSAPSVNEEKYGVVYMSGGTISGNTAESKVTKNTEELDIGQGGGIRNDSVFCMTGGIISSNSALAADKTNPNAGNGGGISTSGGNYPAVTTIKGGTISGNKAGKCGRDVYLNKDQTEIESISSHEKALYTDPGILYLEGTPAIGELYLAEGTYFIEKNTLEGSNVTVNGKINKKGTIVAISEDYQLTPIDARALKNNEGKKVFSVDGDNIVISDENTVEYISLENAVIGNIDPQPYTGNKVKPEPEVTMDGETLVSGRDYIYSYSNNTNAGTAEIKVIGNGNYSGSISRTFTIAPKDINTSTVGDVRDRIYTGEAITPKIKVYSSGILLTEDVDYTLAYENNDETGTGRIIISGTGNYTGTMQKNFEIISANGSMVCATEADIKEAISSSAGTADNPEIIYISDSLEWIEPLTIESGKYVCLVGEKEGIIANGSKCAGDMIEVSGNLELEGITFDGKGGSSKSGRIIMINETGKLNLKTDAIITGGNSKEGCGIYNEGSLIVSGGEITGNRYAGSSSATVMGGGVYNCGTMKMDTGVISDNYSISGGGIYNTSDGQLELEGGFVEGNLANGSYVNNYYGCGGGIYNAGKAEVEELGISENHASEYGGGIYNCGDFRTNNISVKSNKAEKNGAGIYTCKLLEMNGGSITENSIDNRDILRVTACGGGVFLAKGEFIMNDGQICDNSIRSRYQSSAYTASMANGAGVYVSNDRSTPCVFRMNGGTISGNKARSGMTGSETGHGGGVYLMGGNGVDSSNGYYGTPGEFHMAGGTITGNYSTDAGSGIYVNNREKAYSYGAFIVPINCNLKGNAKLYLDGDATVNANNGDNIYFTTGTSAIIEGTLTSEDGSLGITSDSSGDAVIATLDSNQTETEGVSGKFVNCAGKRTVQYRESDKTVILKAIDLKENYTALTDKAEYTYTGSNVQPEVTVTSKNDEGEKLGIGTDYTVSYGRETKVVDSYKVKVKGTGDYTGTIDVEYQVIPADISKIKSAVLTVDYTGKEIVFVPPLGKLTYNGIALKNNVDYKLDLSSYKNNTNAGKASFTIRGIENFTGKRTLQFTITPKSMNNLKFTAISDKAYTGKKITPAVVVKDGSKKLTAGKDYTVTFDHNINPGKATAKITGKSNYSGTKTVYFKILPKKGSISKLVSSSAGKLKVYVKKDTKVSGYQIIIGTNSSCTKDKKKGTLIGSSKTVKTFSKLKKGKIYYVKVRSYKTISGKKCYGSYSAVKKIKVKK